MKTYSREIRWRDLLPGTIALGVLVLSGFFILTRVGVGQLPGPKLTLFAAAEQARGILRGSDVWLAGKRIGTITDISYRDPSVPPNSRVLLKIEVLAQHRDLIRRDSRAQVRRGTRLIGNPVLHLSLGSATAAAIQPGDTIETLEQFDAELVAQRAEEAVAAIPVLFADFRSLMRDAAGVETRLANYLALVASAGVTQTPLQTLVATLDELADRFPRGSLGLFAQDAALATRLASLRDVADSLTRMYDVSGSVAARFMRDSAIVRSIVRVSESLAEVAGLARARADDFVAGARAQALAGEIDRLNASLRALRSDARRHPFRYIVF